MAPVHQRQDEHLRHDLEEVADDLARLRVAFANVYFVGRPGAGDVTPWVLVDTGLASGAAQILDVAAARFGRDRLPSAILLTHAHFDHVGALETLLRVWDVPVYAHPLELPFLTGAADYPPPNPVLGGRLLARLSALFPERGIDLGDRVRPLPPNADVPGMPGWRWVHTPGHTPGHVSFTRASDRVLLAGDAVTTTRQESLLSLATQPEALDGPPEYFTMDWDQARSSIGTIAALRPVVLASGHGMVLRGDGLPDALVTLGRTFGSVPARRDTGVPWGMLTGVAAAAVAGTWLYRRFGKRPPKS